MKLLQLGCVQCGCPGWRGGCVSCAWCQHDDECHEFQVLSCSKMGVVLATKSLLDDDHDAVLPRLESEVSTIQRLAEWAEPPPAIHPRLFYLLLHLQQGGNAGIDTWRQLMSVVEPVTGQTLHHLLLLAVQRCPELTLEWQTSGWAPSVEAAVLQASPEARLLKQVLGHALPLPYFRRWNPRHYPFTVFPCAVPARQAVTPTPSQTPGQCWLSQDTLWRIYSSLDNLGAVCKMTLVCRSWTAVCGSNGQPWTGMTQRLLQSKAMRVTQALQQALSVKRKTDEVLFQRALYCWLQEQPDCIPLTLNQLAGARRALLQTGNVPKSLRRKGKTSYLYPGVDLAL